MPDVWHPVSEEPPEEGAYFVWQPGRVLLAEWAELPYDPNRKRWYYIYGHPMKCVTHWASITYPAPPEVE